MTENQADRPKSGDREFHLHTGWGALAPHCILVGPPERATLIAKNFFEDAELVGNHRGYLSYTGKFQNVPMSVVTTLIGGSSIGTVLPEAVRSGAKRFIRVGSCAGLQHDINLGNVVIATSSVRLHGGASDSWAPPGWPATADYRLVAELVTEAKRVGVDHHTGVDVTTGCFNEGQARPDDEGYIPPRIQMIHDEYIERGAISYNMEDADLFVWASTHGLRPEGQRSRREIYPAASVKAVYVNRRTNEIQDGAGEERAILVGLRAMVAFSMKYPL